MISKFFLPLVAITGLALVPSAPVRIEDILTKASYKVDHVPWLLAKTTSISTVGYRITDGVESVMHTPNDTNYNATGMVFGSETALNMDKYKITNAVFEQNLKRFSKQCLFLDLSLNKYSFDEFKKATDLWKLLENKSSKVRMIPYTDPDSKKTTYQTCKNAIKLMDTLMEKEKRYYAAQEMVKHLPITFQALSGIKKENEELISQQLMLSLGVYHPLLITFSQSVTEATRINLNY